MNLNQEDYIKDRLDPQIAWYSQKSALNQKMYKRLQVITIVTATSIPFLSGYSDTIPFVKIMIGVMGIVVAAIAAISSLYKYQENWIAYRATCELLKQEKYFYLTTTDPYQEEGAFNLLVQRTEMLISKENSNWTQHMNKQQKQIS